MRIYQVATANITNCLRIVASLWSQIFLDSSEYPKSPAEVEWLNMLISEPALLESSLAVTTQHWAADLSRGQNAHVHSIRAINTLIQRINSRQAHTDAVLAVVCTMAIGARLANDNIVWSIHIEGLAHLIRERYARGIVHLPSWFTDLLLSFVRPFAIYIHSGRLMDYSATQSIISLTFREYTIQRLLIH